MVQGPLHFLHAIDEVRDRNHVVGLVIMALLFLSKVQEDV